MIKVLFRHGVAALTYLLLSGPALAGGGLVCTVIDPVWRAGHEGAEQAIKQGVDQMASTVARESATTVEQVVSAIRVATRQRSLSATREAEFQSASAEALAQVYAEQQAAEAIRQAYATYGPAGQAVGGCAAVEEIQKITAALENVDDRAAEIVGSGAIDAAPGSTVSPGAAVSRRLEFDQPKAVSAVAFFEPDTPPEIKDAFMNNVVGIPLAKPQNGGGSTEDMETAERVAMMGVRRIEAIRSPAIVSLGAVRASNEAAGHADTDAGASVYSTSEAMDRLIAIYGGGEEYERWSASLATKSPVGLLKEISRLRSIQLSIENARQNVGDRRQAILAALLSAEAVQ